jgi:glycosyltransferase involved in cell wall biosynthesis
VKASVILPTKDRGEAILPTLASLQALAMSEPWELVIVDNCSGAASRALLQQWAMAHPQGVRYVAEPKLGLNNARNCGIRHSTGAVSYTHLRAHET